MKTIFISILWIVFISADINAQGTYQKQFSSVAGGNKTDESIYAEKYDTCVLLITNKCIIRFNENTGWVYSCKDISIADSNIRINSVYRINDILYIAATVYHTQYAGRILKYNLSTEAIVWQKAFENSDYLELHSITGDRNGNLYMAGTVTDTSGESDFAVIKMDTNATLIWARRIGAVLSNEYPSTIIYNDQKGIYINGGSYPGPFGRSVTLKIDHAGNMLNTHAITTVSGPRIGSSHMRMFNNRLYIVVPTTLGHDGVGPTLITVLDTALSVLRSNAITQIDPRSISCNDHTLLISAQAPAMDGAPGFRSVRMDTGLKVSASRYFNEIPANAVSTTSACFINMDNTSFHFFNVSGNNTVNVIRAGSDETTYCEDTAFSPGSATVNYVDTPWLYVSSPLTMGLFNFSAQVSNTEISSIAKCVPNSIWNLESNGVAGWWLYPNPARDEINISLKKGSPYDITITDMLGRASIATHNKDKIDISRLASGVYIVTITSGLASYTAKFIKE